MISLKQRIRERGFAVNAYCTIPSAFVAEIVGRAGFDSVTLDMQHGLIDYDAAIPMFTGLAACDVVPMVRTPALDPTLVMKLLDAGVLGITCAMIETAAQAEALVRACRYPPRGERSFGPVRAAVLHERYTDRAHALVTILAMIETVEGLRNLDAILAVPDIDGVYIGPMDLAMSMGKPPVAMGQFAPEVDAAIETILAACRAKGKICGMLATDGDKAAALVQRGFQFVTISNDMRALQEKLHSWKAQFDARLGG
jgi:4-hydroxy-2-oxoheptanedioate aldolase